MNDTPSPPPAGQVVRELWALVVSTENGGEGIPAFQVGDMYHPMICSQPHLMLKMIQRGQHEMAEKRITSFKILHFQNPEEFDHTTFI